MIAWALYDALCRDGLWVFVPFSVFWRHPSEVALFLAGAGTLYGIATLVRAR